MSFTFEDIVELINKEEYRDPEFLSDNSFVFVSNKKWTIKHLEYFNKFKDHLEKSYSISLNIAGGGKSCSKMVLEFSGNGDNIDKLLIQLLADIQLREICRGLELEFAVNLTAKESLTFGSEIITKDAGYYVGNTYNILQNSHNSTAMEKQSFKNTGQILNSNVNGNLNHSQINHATLHNEIIKELENKIQELEDLNQVSAEELSEILGDLNDLKTELSKKEPRKKFIDYVITCLSKCTPLIPIVEKLTTMIPI